MAVAGCMSVDEDDDTNGDADSTFQPPLPGLEIPWGLTGCTVGVPFVAVSGSALAPHLPEGFRSLSLAEIALPGAPNPTGDANLGLELFHCEKGIGLAGDVAPIVYGSYFTLVEPPENLREEVEFHIIKWDVLIPDADRRELLRAYGVPAVDGAVTFTQAESQGSVAAYDGSLSLDGAPAASFTGSATVPFGESSFVEFTATPHGLAVWRTQFRVTEGGLGPHVVTAAAGTFAAELIGTAPVEGFGFAGKMDFFDGTITLPAQVPTQPAA